jgi:hypothetical protein
VKIAAGAVDVDSPLWSVDAACLEGVLLSRMLSTPALRRVAVGALGVPLTLGVTGVAEATAPAQSAVQGGRLADVLGQVDPTLNVGGILSGPVKQTATSTNSATSGIVQQQSSSSSSSSSSHGHHCSAGHDLSGGQRSFQAGELVGALVQVNPTANVGGIASGPVDQRASATNVATSGIAQQESGGSHSEGPSQRAAQGARLLGLNLQVNPTLNVGGILSGPVSQQADATNIATSGIYQNG